PSSASSGWAKTTMARSGTSLTISSFRSVVSVGMPAFYRREPETRRPAAPSGPGSTPHLTTYRERCLISPYGRPRVRRHRAAVRFSACRKRSEGGMTVRVPLPALILIGVLVGMPAATDAADVVLTLDGESFSPGMVKLKRGDKLVVVNPSSESHFIWAHS